MVTIIDITFLGVLRVSMVILALVVESVTVTIIWT